MGNLHVCHASLCRIALLALLACTVPLAQALPPPGSYGYGHAARCGVDIDRGADNDAYYLEIGFDESAPAQVATQLRGRLLRIQVWQYSDRRGAKCRTRLQKGIMLPRAADVARLERHDEPGRVLFVIPRRQIRYRP